VDVEALVAFLDFERTLREVLERRMRRLAHEEVGLGVRINARSRGPLVDGVLHARHEKGDRELTV
jgi:hypothetical protein